jgi:hypothetical protein
MKVFEKAGKQNTDETCRMAVERARQLEVPIVSATTEGDAGRRLCEIAAEMGFTGRIVIVTHANGSRAPGVNALREDCREAMKAHGATLVTAAHALSGAERAISTAFKGIYPVEIIAQSLRMLSQGIKVVVEIGSMALDAGAVEYGKPVVALGGTGKGLDTAVVMHPSHANRIFETKLHEILCMPY